MTSGCATNRKTDRYAADHAIDRALMAAVADGNSEALGTLYDRHVKRLLGLAIATLGNPRDAEDLVHDLFMTLWQSPEAYDPGKGTLGYWLQMRLRSRAIDRHRSLAVRARYQQREYHLAADAHNAVEPDVEELVAMEYLVSLSATQREVVQLMYWEGYTCQELAKRLNVPVGTIKSRLAASLRILRREFLSSGKSICQ